MIATKRCFGGYEQSEDENIFHSRYRDISKPPSGGDLPTITLVAAPTCAAAKGFRMARVVFPLVVATHCGPVPESASPTPFANS